jgi:2',5'-phosphodiesterase
LLFTSDFQMATKLSSINPRSIALVCLWLFCQIWSSAAMVRPLNIRVVSYNVLSSHLCEPTYFSTLNPDHLLPANRLPAVLEKLDEEISRNSLICLQEVSYDWAGSLHTHFANKGYHLVTGLYGRKFNGYMGVAVAFPTASMKVVDVDISRLSDKREGGWPRPPKQGLLESLVSGTKSWIRPKLEKLGILSRPDQDPWDYAKNRFNILLTVKLEDKESGKEFALSNYHMPCAFWAPQVMTIHTEMAARHVQTLAGDSPYVLAGDWNIKPYGSSYNLLTTGLMDRGDPEYPQPKWGMEWKPTAKAMRSAYASSEHGEPDFTNHARIKEGEPFIDTLDYIFLSDEWKVRDAKKLLKREEAGGPFPNLDRGEPSDHVLIAADLTIQ